MVYRTRILILFGCIVSWVLPSAAQILPDHTELFSIRMAEDTVQFIRVTVGDTESPRPVLLYLTGSRPIPLILIDEKGPFISCVGKTDYRELARRYHFVMISKPCTPIVKNMKELPSSGVYAPDSTQPNQLDRGYLERNHLDYYVKQTEAVVAFLKNQPWVQKDKIILFGHSQGAHVAAFAAMNIPDLHALGYFSGNVMGRFSEMINRTQDAAKKGRITPEKADTDTENWYAFWRRVCREPESISSGDPPHTWRSFSGEYIREFTAIKPPVFIAYGTEDPGARQCVMLPIYMELAGKTDYRIRPFIGCGHQFEEILPDGTASEDYDKWHWDVLMDEFIRWCEELPDR